MTPPATTHSDDRHCPHGIPRVRVCGLCLIDRDEIERRRRVQKSGEEYARAHGYTLPERPTT